MPPRQRRAQPSESDPSRYRPLGGSSRRYVDTVTRKTISYDAFKKRTTGISRREATARRLGYTSAAERRAAQPRHAVPGARPGTTRSTPIFGGQRAVSRRNRRRGDLAETWGQALRDQGVEVPTVVRGPRRGRVNRSWALQSADFRGLDQRLRELEREAHGKNRATDPFFASDGEYASVLAALGRRPRDAGWRVGDSPEGTVQAMIDLSGNGAMGAAA